MPKLHEEVLYEQIDANRLMVGDVVSYCYSKSPKVMYDDFMVVSQYFDGENTVLMLSKDGEGRGVPLADDKEFGEPIFYKRSNASHERTVNAQEPSEKASTDQERGD